MSEQQQTIPETEQQKPLKQEQPDFGVNMRNAELLANSTIVPESFKGNPGNCLIALGLAKRMNMHVTMIMQNIVLVKGKPSWPGQFIIAIVNASGRFDDMLRFDMKGEGDTLECSAYTTRNGDIIRGTKITMAMAKGEGWLNNQKWKTMPEQMIQYRSATFFGRLYCPDLLNGMLTLEEQEDIDGPAIPRATRKSPLQGEAK